MSFDLTSVNLNEMIEYGTELVQHNDNFDLYLEKMIEKFFPDAHIDVVKIMYRWATFPSLNLFKFEDLKNFEIDIRTKAFKKSIGCSIVGQNQLDVFNNINQIIQNAAHFGFMLNVNIRQYINQGQQTETWDRLMYIVNNGNNFNQGFGFGPSQPLGQYLHSENVTSHVKFTNIIHSIHSNKGNLNDLQEQLNSLHKDVDSMKMSKHKFNDLNKQVQSLTGDIKNLTSQSKNLNDLQEQFNSLHKHVDSMKMAKLKINELNKQVQSLTSNLNNLKVKKNNDIAELHDCIKNLREECKQSSSQEITQLKDKVSHLEAELSKAGSAFEELRDQIRQSSKPEEQHEYIKSIEVIPIYDYVLIKARRRLMHQEYFTAFKFFKRLIQLRYDTPVAVLVLK